MAVAHNTVSLEEFTKPGRETASLEAINRTQRLGDRINFGSGEVFLVMDTRRFSQFSVETFKSDILISGMSNGQSHSNVGSTVEMTIIDPNGISFVNFLQSVLNEKVKANFDGMYFLLRVIFVGHRDNGTTDTVQSTTMTLFLSSLTLDLNYTQGVYQSTWTPILNFDVSRNRRWLQLNTATHFFSGEANTLGGLIDNFNRVLNQKSLEYYNKLNVRYNPPDRAAEDVAKKSGVPERGFGKLVKYSISVPKKWRNMSITGGIANQAVEQLAKRALEQQQQQAQQTEGADIKNPVKNTHIVVQPSMLITDALDEIFKHVNDIAKLGNDAVTARTNAEVRFYKHVVALTSDATSVTVHVHVVEFVAPEIKSTQSARQRFLNSFYVPNPQRGGRNAPLVPKNSFGLDYIFTGKNIDVLSMELKVEDLYMLLYSETGVDRAQLFTSSLQKPKNVEPKSKSSSVLNIRQNDPILMPLTTKEEEENYANITSLVAAQQNGGNIKVDLQQYKKNLSLFYSASPIEASVTLRGNPSIMTEFLIEDVIPNGRGEADVAGKAQSDREEIIDRVIGTGTNARRRARVQEQDDAITIFEDSYLNRPVFCKLNIFGPRTSVDGTVKPADKQFLETYAEEIFIDAYFHVYQVTNIIDRGVFTQEIKMRSHVVFGAETEDATQ
jgi:hypothetical protein